MTDTIHIKTIRSHSGHARFLAECDTDSDGDLIIIREIKSTSVPSSRYSYSTTRNVYRHQGREVVIVETSHRAFSVFDVTGIPSVEVEPETSIIGRHYRGFDGELITVVADNGLIVMLRGDRSKQTWTADRRGAVSELDRNEIITPARNKFGVLYDASRETV